ncbi:MbcA/ParS/Xre antitoxin family protein [Marinobacter sp. LV10R520-4]|jgi:putative toxin-antitoxin system antitoxin component (TIGR02293 family)|uniref:MbcA/ParS/Xre antitoxin family protein n=1 Tax=Marinobacter sp. LV10R520-4 TaxID=1761796 RepID=UPI000BF9E86E|nr:MbcA/ParS/Xre antitoxin family protein [Marinobacter sp. LV10R520-4]
MSHSQKTLEELQTALIIAACGLFEDDDEAANAWLNRPLRAFGYRKPNDHLDSPEDIRMLLDIIGRLEHGVWT